MDLDSIFSGMASAKVSGKGNYLPPGFVGRVEFLPLKWNPNGFKGKSIVFEYKIVESNLESHPAGITANTTVMLDAKNQFANSDLKQIFFAVLGIDVNKVRSFEVDPAPHNEATDALKSAIKDPSEIEGVQALLETKPHTVVNGANKGKEIAISKWRATDEAIKARAEALSTMKTAA